MLSLATRFGSVALESGDCTGFVLVSRYVLRALSPITSSPTHYVCWPELAAARPDLGAGSAAAGTPSTAREHPPTHW